MEPRINFWRVLCHGVEFDTFDPEEALNDTLETLGRAGLPYKTRTRRTREGTEELVLYVKNADRDYARYCTGWRPF